MEFFNPFLKHLWAPDSQAEAVTNINKALSALYHNGVWIKSCEAKQIAIHGLRFLQLYGQLARLAHERKIQKFPLQPKFHYVNHTWIDMLNVAKKSRWVLSPLVFACQMQEDFIGKPSRISRRVSPRSVSHRVLQRSFAATRQCLKFLVAEGLSGRKINLLKG